MSDLPQAEPATRASRGRHAQALPDPAAERLAAERPRPFDASVCVTDPRLLDLPLPAAEEALAGAEPQRPVEPSDAARSAFRRPLAPAPVDAPSPERQAGPGRIRGGAPQQPAGSPSAAPPAHPSAPASAPFEPTSSTRRAHPGRFTGGAPQHPAGSHAAAPAAHPSAPAPALVGVPSLRVEAPSASDRAGADAPAPSEPVAARTVVWSLDGVVPELRAPTLDTGAGRTSRPPASPQPRRMRLSRSAWVAVGAVTVLGAAMASTLLPG